MHRVETTSTVGRVRPCMLVFLLLVSMLFLVFAGVDGGGCDLEPGTVRVRVITKTWGSGHAD